MLRRHPTNSRLLFWGRRSDFRTNLGERLCAGVQRCEIGLCVASGVADSLAVLAGSHLYVLRSALLACFAVTTAACAAAFPLDDQSGNNSATAPPVLREIQNAFQETIARASKSTVTIRAQRLVAQEVIHVGSGRELLARAAVVNGSGVVLSDDGVILTNEHVIQGAGELRVIDSDGNQFGARVIGADARSDLAVLQAESGNWHPVSFVEPEHLARGQWVIAIGNPYGLAHDGNTSASVGVIANLGRRLPGLGDTDDRLYHNMIQFTASIHPGNSGGPLFDLDGRLIGIITAMHTRAPADQGVGFAIPLASAKQKIIDRLRRGEPIVHGYLGLSVRTVSGAKTARDTLVIDAVEAHGPASDAGLKVNDVIRSYNGRPIVDAGQFAELVGETSVGELVSMEVVRKEELRRYEVRVAQRQIWRVACFQGDALLWRGARFCDLTPRLRVAQTRDGVHSGVVVADVVDASAAAAAGLRPGDIVTRIDNVEVMNLEEFERHAHQHKATVELTLLDRDPVKIRP